MCIQIFFFLKIAKLYKFYHTVDYLLNARALIKLLISEGEAFIRNGALIRIHK